MKILFVVKNMRLSNGVASYAMNYYRKLNDKKFHFDFLIINDVESPYYDELKENGSKIYLMPSYKKQPLAVWSYLEKIFKESHYDVIHCNVINSGSIVLMKAKKYNVPVRILHSHATQTGDKRWKEIRNKLFCALSLHYANNYFSCSHLAGDYLFGKNNYQLIPNAIDIEKFIFSKSIREEYRKKNKCVGKTVIMTVGRFTKQKNPFFIVDIVKALKKKDFNFIFWWFGNGEMEESIKKYTIKKQVSQYIKFWGANEKVCEYYSAADIFLLPSIYEGLPVVGIEAQVAGLPILFSEHVTKETQICESVKFLPIDSTAVWVENIILYSNFDRKTNVDSLDLENYNIDEQSTQMAKIYQRLLGIYRQE